MELTEPMLGGVDGDVPQLVIDGRSINVQRPLLMGVVNASPESFSDGGRYASPAQQLELCASLAEAGADMIDIGGQSSITNQPVISDGAEIERVVPLVEWMVAHYPNVIVSVDTYKPAVVRAVLDAGAGLINDVSGLLHLEVAQLCAQHGSGLVIMHTKAPPKQRLQSADLYGEDIAGEVTAFLSSRMLAAERDGMDRRSIIVDPGPDFTKTPYQTVALLRGIDRVRALGRPVLLALSRKDFLGAITGRSPRGRDAATHAALAFFATTPGYIMRVHDVRSARDVVDTTEVLAGLGDIDQSFLLPDEIRHEPISRG